jgi:hypothetical protein
MQKRYYETKDITELQVGDIIFMDYDEDDYPSSRYLILSINYPYVIVFDLDLIKPILTDLSDWDNNDITYIGNSSDILSFNKLNYTEYRWMGIEYDSDKLLIDLHDNTVEHYNIDNDDWNPLSEEFVTYDEDEYTLEIVINEQLKFRINLLELTVKILVGDELKFKKFYNYILAEEGDYVFNLQNELEYVKGE